MIASALIVLFGLSVYARENIQELPFDLSEIIEKVSHHPVQEGNNIIIRSKVYEAFFNEYGIILKLKNPKARAKDLIIPLNGKPEITEGKVVYKTKNSKISFEGKDRGLKFEQIDGS
ncbi:MAG: hypothetical protein OEW70_07565, partial [candidate division WOR-3 bacterium]|nr:hypothetical protein [candidate division WOR-3 bacterium]